MEFKRGESYIINYGNFEKNSIFLFREDGKNYFLDDNGPFILSDDFLIKQTVTVKLAI